jgi:tetratricopeptide (TPR) repeat protein
MTALRRLLLILALAVLTAGESVHAQNLAVQNPAEQAAYKAALNNKDPAKRAQAMEVFIAWYPHSTLRIDAHEQAMAAWQAAVNPAKADAVAARLLQIDPDNVRALANRAYVGRTRAPDGDPAALEPAVAAAERGLAALSRMQKPPAVSETEFVRLKLQFMAVFDGTLGFAALQNKDYARAKRYYLEAVTIDPDNLQDVYQLSVALLEGSPLDPLGFWYGARAIAIAGRKNIPAATIERYVRARYHRYHGSEEGWSELVSRVAAGEHAPPEGFAKTISRALTPSERAVQMVEENDPNALSYSDWVFVLVRRDESPDNRAAAERLWKAIGERQKGGSSRLKIPAKVISATPDRIEAAITDENKGRNRADLEVNLARPLTPVPTSGTDISIVGTIHDYQMRPFRLLMRNAELAQESLPVAGGPCADPRPQMCTRDFRPACGVRRDGSRKTYGNACSACADSEVLSQAAGACP